MADVHLLGAVTEGDLHAQRFQLRVAFHGVIAEGDHHVAPRPASPIEVAARSGALSGGSDYFQELVPQRHHGVLEPPLRDAAVPVADLDPEDRAEILHRGLKARCHQADLSKLELQGKASSQVSTRSVGP